MRPRNDFEREIMALSLHLPSISMKHEDEAFRSCISHYAFIMRTKATCMDCGHSWEYGGSTEDEQCYCPHCGALLDIERTARRTYKEAHYYSVLQCIGEYQVLRMMRLDAMMTKGERARYFSREIGSMWWNADGKRTVVAVRRYMGQYIDAFTFNDDYQIRDDRQGAYIYVANAYAIVEGISPTLMRNGWSSEALRYHTADIIDLLLSNSKAETLWKAKYHAVVNEMRHRSIDEYWHAVKIAVRNGYKITDASMWLDYIKTMEQMGMDTHNAKYACPSDLREEHDKVMRAYRRKQDAEKLAKQLAEAKREEQGYAKAMGRFFGIAFTDGRIVVKVLDSVRKIAEEGASMHHCVYQCGYYKKHDSLILGATIDGERIETIEVSLKTFEVVQSRGVCNTNTEHHKAILALVRQNMNKIREVA